MKKFKFRLERILKYRGAVKNEKLRDLMLKVAKLKEEEQILQDLETAWLKNGISENKVMLGKELELFGQYGNRLKLGIDNQKLLIIEAEDVVEKATVEYQEARKDEKVLETLKSKRLEEYRKYVEKEEEKSQDELSVHRGNTFRS